MMTKNAQQPAIRHCLKRRCRLPRAALRQTIRASNQINVVHYETNRTTARHVAALSLLGWYLMPRMP